jgi:hypothetical protein
VAVRIAIGQPCTTSRIASRLSIVPLATDSKIAGVVHLDCCDQAKLVEGGQM